THTLAIVARVKATSMDPLTPEAIESEPCSRPEQNQREAADVDPQHDIQTDAKSAEEEEEEEEDEGGNCGIESESKNQECSPADWIEERFRIDRKKLETMLYVNVQVCIGYTDVQVCIGYADVQVCIGYADVQVCFGYADVQVCFGYADVQVCFGYADVQVCFGYADVQARFGYADVQARFGYADVQVCFGYTDVQVCIGYADVQVCISYADVQVCFGYTDVQVCFGYTDVQARFGYTDVQARFGYTDVQARFGYTDVQVCFSYTDVQARFGYTDVQVCFGYTDVQARFGYTDVQVCFGYTDVQVCFGYTDVQACFSYIHVQVCFSYIHGQVCFSYIHGQVCFSYIHGQVCFSYIHGQVCFSYIHGQVCFSYIHGQVCFSYIHGQVCFSYIHGQVCFGYIHGQVCFSYIHGQVCFSYIHGQVYFSYIHGQVCFSYIHGQVCFSYIHGQGYFGYTDVQGYFSYTDVQVCFGYTDVQGYFSYTDVQGYFSYTDVQVCFGYTDVQGYFSYTDVQGYFSYTDVQGYFSYTDVQVCVQAYSCSVIYEGKYYDVLALKGPAEGTILSGEEFFEKVSGVPIMRETNTQVKWPSKLKIGAKSKKDPHVKVEGKRDDVLEAKRKILELLETKVNKVTLKMDVTHTEHSHVIGKGGGNIKKVMEDTSCHIHFPDSNRHSATGEKSNQVSIAGPIEGVESARRHIRDLQPLVLTFDLPLTLVGGVVTDAGSPLIQHVAQAFGVSVTFRTQPKLYCSTCVVRGLQGNCAAVKKATCVLMELLLGREAAAVAGVTGVMVSTQLDVTSQQHLFLLGQNGANFLSVMHQTQTQIVLPDLTAPQHTPSLLIQGTADGVCLARQQLMDCLPVCLMFEMKEEGESDPRKLAQMMQSLAVFISVKPKAKQTAKSVVVKGLERNIASLYEARRLLLGLESCEVSMTAKNSCEVSMAVKPSLDPLLVNNSITGYWFNMLMQQLQLTETASVPAPDAVLSAAPVKPRPSPPPGLAGPAEEGRIALRGTDTKLEKIPESEDQSTDAGSKHSELQEQEVTEVKEVIVKPVGSVRRNSQSEVTRDQTQESRKPMVSQTSPSQTDELNKSLTHKQHHHFTILLLFLLQDHDYERKKLLATQAMQKKPVVTEVRTPTDTWSGLGFSKSMPAEAVKELRSVSRRCYRSYLNNQQQSWGSQSGKERIAINGSDSENWRERRGSVSSSSVSSSSSSSPTSCSSSSSSAMTAFSSSRTSEGFLKSSSYFEGVSRSLIGRPPSPAPQLKDDLLELLIQLGLEKYNTVFQDQEIDYQTFLTLSEEDLKEVGVSTFGARRKMLLAISDLNKSKMKAPEALTVKSGYLEGGASGRLPRIMDEDVAAKSNRW
ncbi:hypothetical protein NFI96_022081, partial [Prochilodus magdalenae]